MPDAQGTVVAFGPFSLFPAERRLEKDGAPVPLGGRPFDLLTFLVERAGQVVSNQELLRGVWREINVEESSLRFNIKKLRTTLCDGQDAHYITNVPGRGYCFVAPVERRESAPSTKPHGAPLGLRANLPNRAVTMIGRSASLDIVSKELSRRRLVTIAGAAGIGKTTLAIATAAALRANFGDAVFFVDLAPIEDQALVFTTLSSLLGGVGQAEDSVEALAESLQGKRFLVVFDNCEHFVEIVAKLAERIVYSVPGAHVLATSRETLRVAGEYVHRLMPLDSPPRDTAISAAQAMTYPAVQLFVDRATAGLGEFTLDDATARPVAEICRRLDGIPFAIELAAAHLEFFGAFELANKLNDMFAVLTRGRRFALPRHRTLRATLDWGYGLLTPVEKTVLRCISIFRAQFTLEAALAVAVSSSLPHDRAIEAMANLVAKSLLTTEGVRGIVQFRLLEVTRIYATEKLNESDDGSEIARRHAEYYSQLFEGAPNEWGSEPGKLWLDAHVGRIDDVRAAIDWSFSPVGDTLIGFRLVLASARLWFRTFLNLEYSERIDKALRHAAELSTPEQAMEMRLQVTLGHVFWYSLNKPDRAERAFARALELGDKLNDAQARLQGLWGLWAVHRSRGLYQKALLLAENYVEIAKNSGNQAFILLGDRILGLTHHYRGNQATAQEKLEGVRVTALQNPNASNTEFQLDPEIATTTILTRILWLRGFPDKAAAMLQAGIEAARRTNHAYSMSYVLGIAGCSFSLWVGNFNDTDEYLRIMTENAINNTSLDQWRQCYGLVLRLRRQGAREALIAAYLEPRIDLSTFCEIFALSSAPHIPLPVPNEDTGEALWCLPEVLRVNAEILLYRDGADAARDAELTLLRSIEIARLHSSLAWELRSAISLTRLWHRSGRVLEARTLLSDTYNKFSEGFNTLDLLTARQLLSAWP